MRPRPHGSKDVERVAARDVRVRLAVELVAPVELSSP